MGALTDAVSTIKGYRDTIRSALIDLGTISDSSAKLSTCASAMATIKTNRNDIKTKLASMGITATTLATCVTGVETVLTNFTTIRSTLANLALTTDGSTKITTSSTLANCTAAIKRITTYDGTIS